MSTTKRPQPTGSKQYHQQLGPAIRALRIKRGWTVGEFAELLGEGISYSHLQNLEHENRVASIEHLNRIARQLDVPLMAISRDITIGSKVYHQHGPAIRALREREGLSVQDLANLISVSYGHLQNIEHENKAASREHMDSIAYFLGQVDYHAISRDPLPKHTQAAA